MQLCTLASGSSGNCLLISHGDTHILVDAGISARRITLGLGQLGLTPGQLAAVLVTHEHSDHIGGLDRIARRYCVPVWASEGTGAELLGRSPELGERLHTFSAGARFSIADLEVCSFSTPHDAADSVGYAVAGGGKKIAVVTDLGHVTAGVMAAVRGAHMLVLESNHDVATLKSGVYPYFLKQRILGERGHLCNEDAGALACEAVRAGTQQVLLAHLSRENNTPQLALSAVSRLLTAMGASLGREVLLDVAPREEAGPLFAL